eukprot:4704957-Pleurochrysis_carterae.AAC.4
MRLGSRHACGGWAHLRLRSGSGSVALSDCVGHARYEIQNLGSGAQALRKLSASMHTARVQNGKLCMRTKRSGALRRSRHFATRDKKLIKDSSV